jgi:hypothetical protein
MIKIAFVNKETQLVGYIASPANDQMYEDGNEYGDYIARHISVTSDDNEVLTTWHWNGTEFKTHLPQQGQYEVWDTTTFSYKLDEELFYKTKEMEVKQERQQLLAASDWTDTVSASTRLENYNAWQFYRQQLRDITTQEGYPFSIVWPSQPV